MRRLAAIVLFAGFAAGLAALSVGQWLALNQLSRSADYVDELASEGWISDEKLWHRHDSALRAVAPFAPFDSRIHWQLGELERWQAAGLRLWPARQREHLGLARRQYMRAVLESPNQGDLLARIAYRLAALNDPLAIGLMYRAMEIAPYELRVQFYVAAVGMRFLDVLNSEEKRLLETTLSRAMESNRLGGRIRVMANRYGRKEWLNGLVGKNG